MDLLKDKNDLFENKGDFEIISLPKIIGSVSGGIVITKDKNFYEYAKKEQIKNKELGQYQSRCKFEEINKKNTFVSHTCFLKIFGFRQTRCLLELINGIFGRFHEKSMKNQSIAARSETFLLPNLTILV